MPYLKMEVYDNRLKKLVILTTIGVIMTIIWGWNGSSGMVFACYWEITKGQKMGIYGIIFVVIAVGSLFMEHYHGWIKIV